METCPTSASMVTCPLKRVMMRSHTPYTSSQSEDISNTAVGEMDISFADEGGRQDPRDRKTSTHWALQALGIPLFIKAKEHPSQVTAALLPEGLQSEDLQRFLREKYGILIAGGVGPLRKRVFRIGHMGYSAQPWLVNRVIAGIARFLHEQ
jgi:hypothetical protein